MTTSQTRRSIALFGVAGVAVAASLAMAAFTLSTQRMHVRMHGDIPLPFAMVNRTPILGSIMTIGMYNDIPVDEVFFLIGEVSQMLQDAIHEDRLFLVRTSMQTVQSTAATIADAFGYAGDDAAGGPEVYLYLYSDEFASLEREAQKTINNGGTLTMAERFPGLFLAMGNQSIAAMQAFTSTHGLNFGFMNTTAVQSGMLMLVVVNDTNVSFQIRCGNNIIEAPEECDDGNTINTDSCTNACRLAACADTFLQPFGTDDIDDVPNGNSDDEECDDGNLTPSDSCSSICRDEFCGDWITQAGGTMNEQCDNGRACLPSMPVIPSVNNCDTYANEQICISEGGICQASGGDGCSETCQIELSSSSSSSSSSSLSTSSSSSSSNSSAISSSSSSFISSASSSSQSSQSSSESSISSSGSKGGSSSSADISSSSSSSVQVSSSSSSSAAQAPPSSASSSSSSGGHSPPADF